MEFKWMKIAALLAVMMMTGCSVHKEMTGIEAPDIAVSEFSVSGSVKLPEQWWSAFDDEQLDMLINRALTENLTVRQAWSRLDHARAVVRMAGAMKLPQVNAETSAQRTRSGLDSFNMTTRALEKTIDQISLSGTVSYQLDLWKKIDSGQQAEILGFQASRKDVEATAMAIAASVADVWFSINEQLAAIDLLKAQLKVNEDYLELVEYRFSQGLASAVDVFQQRLQAAATRNQIPRAVTTRKVLENQLALLIGEAPQDLPEMAFSSVPALPELPITGLPVELLRKRPDVKAAEIRIFATDKRVAVAVADQFPSLSIATTVGSRSNSVSDLVDRWFLNLAGNLLGPIFDGGRRAAEVDRNKAILKERMLAWENTLLGAIREVEDSLVQEEGQKEVLKGINLQINLAQQTLEQARSRYVNGLSSYLNVLTSLQSLQQLERAELNARRLLISNRVRLYVALGGNWTEKLERSQEDSIE